MADWQNLTVKSHNVKERIHIVTPLKIPIVDNPVDCGWPHEMLPAPFWRPMGRPA